MAYVRLEVLYRSEAMSRVLDPPEKLKNTPELEFNYYSKYFIM